MDFYSIICGPERKSKIESSPLTYFRQQNGAPLVVVKETSVRRLMSHRFDICGQQIHYTKPINLGPPTIVNTTAWIGQHEV